MKNINWFHGFVFAVFVTVMVNAGDQVKSHLDSPTNLLFKSSVIASVLAIVVFGVGLYPANISGISNGRL